MRPVLIQGAMDVETDYLVSQLEDPREMRAGAYRYWRGFCRGRDIVVSRTGVGTIAAAGATALGIREFTPEVVINQGLAGAHRRDIHRGDIVVGERCVPIHDLLTPVKGRGEGSDPSAWELHDHDHLGGDLSVPADPDWVERFCLSPYEGGQKFVGALGSGDIWNREYDRITDLHSRYGHLCEDMESIAAFQICRAFGIPCVGVRIISNNELTGELYRRELGAELQRFILGAMGREPEE